MCRVGGGQVWETIRVCQRSLVLAKLEQEVNRSCAICSGACLVISLFTNTLVSVKKMTERNGED